ncbi:BRCT domain containing protein [Pseudohyphozyma bogoriensis]|nr:BRCT domain containing protein [Pseudohyphozyma bogoriensis]
MVWVITGTIQNGDDDKEQSIPPESSHYLRPDRAYRCARSSLAVVSTNKDGVEVTTHTKDTPVDFRIKNPQIPKEGAWDLTTGEWTREMVEDQPDSATNLDPYTLSIRPLSSKPDIVFVERDGELKSVDPGESYELQSGDVVSFPKARKYSMTVKWVPVIICYASSPNKTVKDKHAAEASSLGIKIAYKIFLPHHTHLIVRKISGTASICIASLLNTPICSQLYLEQIFLKGALFPRPPDAPEYIDLFYKFEPKSSAKEDVKKAKDKQKGLTAVQEQLLSMNSDVGYDWGRYWGHSFLEEDWAEWPDPAEFVPKDREGDYTESSFQPDERRKGLFEGVLGVSFRSGNDVDSLDRRMFEVGGGHFISLDPPQQDASIESIISIIDEFKASQGIQDRQLKSLIFAPNSSFSVGVSNGEPENASVLRGVAKRLGVKSYTSSHDVVGAIHECNISILFAEPVLNESQMLLAPSTAPQSTPAPPTPASSFRSVPGTHPDEQTYRPANQGGAEAGPSGAGAAAGPAPRREAEVVVPPVRKLTRRAKTNASSVDEFWASSVATGGPRTQADAQTLEETVPASSGMEVDSSSMPAPTFTKPRLKRRAGLAQQPIAEEEDGRPQKKARSDYDSDDSTSSQSQARAGGKKGKATQLSVVDEDEEDPTIASSSSTSRRKKRDASEAVSSADEGGSRGVKEKKRARSERPEEVVKETPKEKEKVSTKPAPPAAKGKKAVAGKKGAANEESDKTNSNLLRMKTLKGKGKELDQAFNDDFNALKIVKPALAKMHAQKGHRAEWDEEDAEDEMERMIKEDQARREHPEQWPEERTGKGIFDVHVIALARRERPLARDDIEVDAQWAGRPNFKKFRPKNSTAPRVPREERVLPALVVADIDDYGLGKAYESQNKDSKKKKPKRDTFDEADPSQTKLSFKPKPKAPAKGKGKGKARAQDSDDDDASDVTMKEVDELASDDDGDSDGLTPTLKSAKSSASSKTAASTSKAKAKAKAPEKKEPAKRPARKVAQAPIVIDDSDDDSDDGLRFKGFAGTKRKSPSSLHVVARPTGSRYEVVPHTGPGTAIYVIQPTRAQLKANNGLFGSANRPYYYRDPEARPFIDIDGNECGVRWILVDPQGGHEAKTEKPGAGSADKGCTIM